MRSTKQILKLFLLLLCLSFLGGVIFIYITILQAPIDRLEKITIIERGYGPITIDNAVTLAADSIVDANELKTYFLFSEHIENFSRWEKDKIAKKEIERFGKGKFYLNKDLQLSPPMRDDCDVVYCYQYRIPFKKIPSIFWKGLIGIEDYRFLKHFGVDFKSIFRALFNDLIKLKLEQGGSTLTQQLVKNLFYSNQKKFSRKIKEIIVAVYIESKYSKENIIEAYFNEVFWGALQGLKIKGLYAASLFYFDSKPQGISPYQAAILIGMLKGPNFYHPIRHLDRLIKRTNTIYNKLVSLNLFSSKKSNIWNKKQWQDWQKKLINNDKKRLNYSLWRSLKLDNSYFKPYDKFVFVSKARQLNEDVKKRVGKRDIAIKAIIGPIGTDVNNPQKQKLFTYYSKYERSKDRAIKEEKHQVGSILKPIIYRIFIQNGKLLQDLVSTRPLKLKLKSGFWSPSEAHKKLPAEVTLATALLRSYNRPVIRVAQEVGFDIVENELQSYIPSLLVPLAEYPSQLLGAIELSLFEIFQIYSKFIRQECYENTMQNELSANKNILYILSDPKLTTIRRVVSENIGEMSFFGKTGTSNSGHNNWFIFFDGNMLGVIWVGLEGNKEGQKLNLYGSSTAFSIFQNFTKDRGQRFNELSCLFFND